MLHPHLLLPSLSCSHLSLLSLILPYFLLFHHVFIQNFGEHGGTDLNVVRTIIDKVRKRKGLLVEEKIVVNAEKQRNLNKKK